MCTVVTRCSGTGPVQILALRDEVVGRPFVDPGRWWPAQPDVVGGRDELAGGTWSASRISTGVTALVLNRPDKPSADEGAPSRGMLPLWAVRHGNAWTDQAHLGGMASFVLVLASPKGVTSWDYDGARLTRNDHPVGTTMFTSGGAEDGKAERYLGDFSRAAFPQDWRSLVQLEPPADDLGALVVRHEHDGRVFATVFGQVIDARPGRLRLEYSRTPWVEQSWTATEHTE